MTPKEEAVIEAAIEWRQASTASTVQRAETATWDAVDALIASRAPAEPEWVTTRMINVLANDRIRLDGDETTVLRSNSGLWYVDTSDYWRPKSWKHVEFRMEIADYVAGLKEYPPNMPVDVLCSPERKAVLALQDAFPGSEPVSSDVN